MHGFANWLPAIRLGFFVLLAFLWNGYVLSKPVVDLNNKNSSLHECSDYLIIDRTKFRNHEELDTVHFLANRFLFGVCAVQNAEAAVELMALAADKGHAKSAHQLAELYYVGEVVPVDLKKSLRYFHLAAEAGSLKAQHEFGIILLKEAASENQRYQGLYWLGMAANQDDGFSAYLLGMIHQVGLHGVPKNPCLALDWYASAHTMGFSDTAGPHARLHSQFNSACN